MILKLFFSIILVLLVSFFTACSPKSSNKNLKKYTTGQFIDTYVEGLNYSCSTGESNTTNSLGEFICLNDANISFSIGNFLYLGQVPIQEQITPVTLFKDDAVAALNLMQLLQTLDIDQNLNNGIKIDVTLMNKLKDANISFHDADFDAVISETLEIPIIDSITAYNHYNEVQNSLETEKLDVDYIPPSILTKSQLKINENIKEIVTLDVLDHNNVHFSIDDTIQIQELFTLDATTGKLSFASAPDYETKNSYSVKIKVSDGANVSYKTFTIDILDVDENPPLINTKSQILIKENQIFVLDVNASDESNLNYAIRGKDKDFFNIDAQSGRLSFKKPADYEEQSSYTLTLLVSDGLNSSSKELKIFLLDIQEKRIPVLVILMNWSDYAQRDALTWHNKIFNKSQKSVSAWYEMVTDGEVDLYPVKESYATENDGVIMVNMNEPHPGNGNDAVFRDTYIKKAITNVNVINNVDFAALDTNHDKEIGKNELQIIFVVAGGEESHGDNPKHSIWAHAWSFDSLDAPTVDGIAVLKYNGDSETSGMYVAVGAQHGSHLATIGIIAHELGHALLNLFDFYDDGGGSGLGWYDIMSGGSWGQKVNEFPGETPTEFSAFNKKEANFSTHTTIVDSSQTITIKCSSLESIKLKTSKTNEYFLLECRDSKKVDSDIAFATLDGGFNNRLFTLLYHVDDAKDSDGYFVHSNIEDGTQTNTHHYNLAIVEKETNTLMTSTEFIDGSFADVYTEGDTIDTVATQLYNGTFTNYKLEILNDNYDNRSVTIKITK